MTTSLPRHGSTAARASGILLLASTSLAAVFMAHHPTSGTHDAAVFADRAARGIRGLSFVHGVLIVMLLLMAIGLAAVIDSIGRRRLLRRLALTSLLLGAGCGTLAALINGFILPTTAAQLAGSDAESLSLLVSLCLNANAVLARVCVLGLSTHAAICGIGLWPWGGLRRIAAIAGLTCGLLSPALLLIGSLPMNVGGFGSFVAIHSLWSILAGFSLVDSRSETPGSEAAI